VNRLRRRPWIAYLVLAAALPAMAFAQAIPGSPFGGTSGATGFDAGSNTYVCASGQNCTIATNSGSFVQTRAYYFNAAKNLTEAAATSVVRIGLGNLITAGGTVEYSVYASDSSTDVQSRSGVIPWAVVNDNTVETCTVGTPTTATEVVAVSSGTLTVAITCDTTPVNAIDIQFNATASIVQTTLAVSYAVHVYSHSAGQVTVTPQ
jgi:hypothetical protein